MATGAVKMKDGFASCWLALPHLPDYGIPAADVEAVGLLDTLLDATATRPAVRLSVSKPAP